jgi:hypothetical protein
MVSHYTHHIYELLSTAHRAGGRLLLPRLRLTSLQGGGAAGAQFVEVLVDG